MKELDQEVNVKALADEVSKISAGVEVDFRLRMEAAVVLARLSAVDDAEAGARADAARELITRFHGKDVDTERVLDLLNTLVPQASINDRREAAEKLATLSTTSDLTIDQHMEVASELTRLITGNALNAEQRISAANELTRRLNEGELDAKSALELMDAIAPETGIKARTEALNALAVEINEDDWDDEKAVRFANELFTLATGDDLNVEERSDAAVDLSGEVVKAVSKLTGGGEGVLGDDDVDKSTEAIKAVLKGDTESVKDLLGETNKPLACGQEGDLCVCSTPNKAGVGCNETKVIKEKYVSAYLHMNMIGEHDWDPDAYDYARAYVGQLEEGESHELAHNYAYLSVFDDYNDIYEYKRLYVEQREKGKSHEFAHNVAHKPVTHGYHFATQRELGRSFMSAFFYRDLRHKGSSDEYARAFSYYADYAYPEWSKQEMFERNLHAGTTYAKLHEQGRYSQYAYYYIAAEWIHDRHIPVVKMTLNIFRSPIKKNTFKHTPNSETRGNLTDSPPTTPLLMGTPLTTPIRMR